MTNNVNCFEIPSATGSGSGIPTPPNRQGLSGAGYHSGSQCQPTNDMPWSWRPRRQLTIYVRRRAACRGEPIGALRPGALL